MSSTGTQTACFYGLEKVLKKDIQLRPVLRSISSWKFILHLEQIIGKVFDKIEGANMETNTQPAREIFEKAELDSDENIISLDFEFCKLKFHSKRLSTKHSENFISKRSLQTFHTSL